MGAATAVCAWAGNLQTLACTCVTRSHTRLSPGHHCRTPPPAPWPAAPPGREAPVRAPGLRAPWRCRLRSYKNTNEPLLLMFRGLRLQRISPVPRSGRSSPLSCPNRVTECYMDATEIHVNGGGQRERACWNGGGVNLPPLSSARALVNQEAAGASRRQRRRRRERSTPGCRNRRCTHMGSLDAVTPHSHFPPAHS